MQYNITTMYEEDTFALELPTFAVEVVKYAAYHAGGVNSCPYWTSDNTCD